MTAVCIIKHENTSEDKWSPSELNTPTVVALTELWFPLVVIHSNSNYLLFLLDPYNSVSRAHLCLLGR